MPAYLPIVTKFVDKGLKDAEGALGKFGRIAAATAAAATAAVTGIAIASVKEFAKFDSALNQSLAIMGDVSETMRGEMSDAAREVAKNTTFSAEQAAESFFFLASAGLSAEQAVAAMPQVAKFAQAGMFDMATATDLATDAQSALGLTSDDTAENLANLTRVTDVFVKANTLANTSVEQLATAFTVKAGNALKSVGKDVEEGAAVLALFADQGIKGEQAGTLLSNTIFGLTDRARASSKQFEELGIEVFDAEGNMKNLADIADDFTVALSGMTTEQQINTIAQLGFNKQSRTGLLALMGNADAIREYEGALRDAGGTVDEISGKQLESFSAQLALLKSRVADVGIDIGSTLVPILVSLFDKIAPIIDRAGPQLTSFFEQLAPVIETAIIVILELLEAIEPLLPFLGELFIAFADVVVAILPLLKEILPMLIWVIKNGVIPILTVLAEMLKAVLVEAVTFFKTSFESIGPLVEGVATSFKNAWQGVSNFFRGLVNGMIGMIEGFINGAINGLNGLIRALNRIQLNIPATPFSSAFSIGVNLPTFNQVRIPRLADGGIVMPTPGGTFANIAEAGKPEAVIPLDRFGEFGSKTINYNVTVNAGMGADGNRIGEQIVNEILRFERSSGRVFARA
jgi:TP901 family phage tail tape measure protein